MDTSSTLMGMGMLLIFIAPVAIFLIGQSAEKKSNRKQLYLLAKQHNLNLNKTEFLPNLSLGLDEASRKFLTCSSRKEQKCSCIDLADISSSTITTTCSSDEASDRNFDDVAHISVKLNRKGGSLEERIIFFEKGETSILQKEEMMHKAETWNLLLQKNLKEG